LDTAFGVSGGTPMEALIVSVRPERLIKP